MPELKFKIGDKARCKCHEACDATLIIIAAPKGDLLGNNLQVYEVKHFGHHLRETHYVSEDMVERIEAK